ncbi:MAG: uridylate kinase [Christensenellales bacterium]|jgi:glutamate 5-kinase
MSGKEFYVDIVGKIGSMALIRREDMDIDYNIFARIGSELRPGMIWVSSGATEIGRLDYIKRHGCEPEGDLEEIKSDYAAQGQAILMENYRRFINPAYSVRQLLVEHTHFNDPIKREYIRKFLMRAAEQGAVPIVNYNDPVSFEENRRMELSALRSRNSQVVECIDNDETAGIIALIVKARQLVILTSVEGIYRDVNDPSTLVETITGPDADTVEERIRALQRYCQGASRAGAGGAFAKLEYVLGPVRNSTVVYIGHARHHISDILEGRAACTRIGIGL